MDAKSFRDSTDKELNVFLDAIEAEWGFRPPVEVVVETGIRISADFNIVGFAHKGRRFDVRDSNAHRRTPRAVARAIAQEIVTHRNTCADCGTGTPPLWERLAIKRYPARYRPYDGAAFSRPPDAAERLIFPGQSREFEKLLALEAALPKIDDSSQRWMD